MALLPPLLLLCVCCVMTWTSTCVIVFVALSAMLGVRGGVSKRLKDKVPFLAAHRCIAHHLALACGQLADEIS